MLADYALSGSVRIVAGANGFAGQSAAGRFVQSGKSAAADEHLRFSFDRTEVVGSASGADASAVMVHIPNERGPSLISATRFHIAQLAARLECSDDGSSQLRQ